MINFNLSIYEAGQITVADFMVLSKINTDKVKNEAELNRNVILNAIINSNRKKNTKIIKLFTDNSKRRLKEKTKKEILAERRELFGEGVT